MSKNDTSSGSGRVPTTDFAELLGELNAGIFEQKINRAISDIAANVCTHHKPGKLTIVLDIKQIDESNQVSITHMLKTVCPKPRGKISEEDSTSTPLHVGRGGLLTLFPNDQTRMEMGAGAATGRTDGLHELEDK